MKTTRTWNEPDMASPPNHGVKVTVWVNFKNEIEARTGQGRRQGHDSGVVKLCTALMT